MEQNNDHSQCILLALCVCALGRGLPEKVQGGGRGPPPLRRGVGSPPPHSPPNCRTPLGVTHWLAAAPVAQMSSGARGLPYTPPTCANTAARRYECAAAVAVVWAGMAKALRACPPLGQRSSPWRRRPQRKEGGGGGRTRMISATDLVAFGQGRLRPLGGDSCRGNVRRLRDAEMRLKTSGSDAGSSAKNVQERGLGLLFGVGRGGWGGGVPRGVGGDGGARGHRPGAAVPPSHRLGGERVSFPPARSRWPLIY